MDCGFGGEEGVYGEDFRALGDAMDVERIDLGGLEVLPGLVDSHTHIVFAAPRHEEFEMRLRGELRGDCRGGRRDFEFCAEVASDERG